MKPLNGKKRMTQEERNARRRELDKNPFHRSLTRKTANAYRMKNKERLNAARREKYKNDPELRERERERGRKWRLEHKDKVKESWRKWADKNREYLRKRDEARAGTRAEIARRKEEVIKRARRFKEDHEFREHVREVKRKYYHLHKNDATGLRWMLMQIWLPKWRRVEAAGEEAIEKYRKRCAERTRRYFDLWLAQSPIIGVLIEKGGRPV